jgi:transposase InsO family protein
MPWKDCSIMSIREEFVVLASVDDANVSSLCRRFGISRRTGYKWIARHRVGGAAGLADRSRRPRGSPSRSGEAIEQLVVSVRTEHPAWGPRKLRRVLLNRGHDAAALPAPSTIGQILLRQGLIDPAASAGHRAFVRFEKQHPNELWQMDFKGHVAMLDGQRCHPLTVLDDHSRFALCVRACGNEQTGTVQSALVELFERYGQPSRMLCDNGSPWGSGGGPEPYTFLSVWLLRHGIGVSHGRPRHPQTQGKDERFHRTLIDELLGREPLRDLAQGQERFDDFRQTYNHVRPHEALALDCPITRYRSSPRSYAPDPLAALEYPPGDAVRTVDAAGRLSYRGRCCKIGKPFVGQRLGLRADGVADGVMIVRLGEQEIGTLNLREQGAATALCCARPSVATLPTAEHSPGEESVTHVSEHVSPLTPV